MNTVLTGLRTLLLDSNDISTLVGARVYALKFPQSVTYPAVRMLIVSQMERVMSHDGDSLLAAFRVQIDSAVKESSGVNAMASAATLAGHIKTVLSGFKGVVGSPPVVTFASIKLLNVVDLYDPDELTVVRRAQDYEVWVYE